jgi:hypothetical protein
VIKFVQAPISSIRLETSIKGLINHHGLSESLYIAFRCRRRWLSGTILASLVLDSTGFWVRVSARHLFFGISPRGEISQEGFSQGLVSPPATSRYIGPVGIISEAPLVSPNGC